MKVMVVDDEPLAQQRLQQLLSQIEQVSAIVVANNGQQAVEMSQINLPDVVLLDIRMPGMDGLEAAQHLSQMEKTPAIIFTTAYDEYALDAFKVHAIDYLLKPIRAEKLKHSLEQTCQLNLAQINAIKSQPNSRTNITAKISGNIKLIPVKDIYFFQADQKYVTVKYIGGETIIEDTLKNLQKEFESEFIRVHRNALVASQFITGIQKGNEGHSYIIIKDCDDLVEISRRHLPTVKNSLMNI